MRHVVLFALGFAHGLLGCASCDHREREAEHVCGVQCFFLKLKRGLNSGRGVVRRGIPAFFLGAFWVCVCVLSLSQEKGGFDSVGECGRHEQAPQ